MKFRIFWLALICTFTFLGISFAAINIENRTGPVKIFMPDGKQVIIQTNEPLPVIPDGAIITIQKGSATIATTGKSTVQISIGNYTVMLKEKSKINLTLNPEGTVSSMIILGTSEIIRRPEPYREPFPPAATELLNTTGGEGGRDISPSQ